MALREKSASTVVPVTRNSEPGPKLKLSSKIGKNLMPIFGRPMIKEVLDQGFRPGDINSLQADGMKSIIQNIIYKPREFTEMEEITEEARQLSLQSQKQKN